MPIHKLAFTSAISTYSQRVSCLHLMFHSMYLFFYGLHFLIESTHNHPVSTSHKDKYFARFYTYLLLVS